MLLKRISWLISLGPSVHAFASWSNSSFTEALTSLEPSSVVDISSIISVSEAVTPTVTPTADTSQDIELTTSTSSRNPKVRLESSVNGFDDLPTPVAPPPRPVPPPTSSANFDARIPPAGPSGPVKDIGSIIQSILTRTRTTAQVVVPTPNNRSNPSNPDNPTNRDNGEPGDRGNTQIIPNPVPAQTPAQDLPQVNPIEPFTPQETTQPPATNNQDGPQNEQPAPPAITQAGLTLQPILITTSTIATLENGQVTTTQIPDYAFVIGTQTLDLTAPITLGTIILALSTDTAGSTILIAGNSTTQLSLAPAPEAAAAAAITPAPSQVAAAPAIPIATTILSGTTQYILGTQTLAPGQQITVEGVTVSINTADASTILVVNGVTTMFGGGVQGTETETLVTTTTARGTATTTVGDGNKPASGAGSVGGGSLELHKVYVEMGFVVGLVGGWFA